MFSLRIDFTMTNPITATLRVDSIHGSCHTHSSVCTEVISVRDQLILHIIPCQLPGRSNRRVRHICVIQQKRLQSVNIQRCNETKIKTTKQISLTSIGFHCGQYLGKNKTSMPTARSQSARLCTRCDGQLSRMTTSTPLTARDIA